MAQDDVSMPWVAFETITAAKLNKRLPIWVVKSANEAVTSSSTLQNDDELVVTLPANSRWRVEAVILASGTTNGLKSDWTIPADATLVPLKQVLGPDSASTDRSNTNVRLGAHAHDTVAEYGVDDGAAIWTTIREEFIVDMVSEGDLQFRWAQVISNAVAVNVRAGSWLRAERIS